MLPSIFSQQIFILFLAIAELFIGLFVLLNNPKSIINRSFFFFIFGIAFWIIGVVLLYMTYLFAFDKLVFGAVFFMITGLVVFTRVFPYEHTIKNKFYLLFLPWVLLYLGLPFNLFIKKIIVDSTGRIQPINGPLFPVFLLLFAGYITLSIGFIFPKYRKSIGLARTQMQYLFLGIGSFAISSFIFDILLPAVGIYQFNLLGPAMTLIFVSLIAYAIVVHHLMDIWIVVRLGAIFSILFGAISFIYIGLMTFLSQYAGFGSVPSLVIASLIITLTFEPLKKFIEEKTDTIFFRRHYKVDEVIDELTSTVHKISLDLGRILSAFNEIVKRNFKVREATIAVLTPKETFLVNPAVDGIRDDFELSSNNPLVEFLTANNSFILNRDEILQNLNRGAVRWEVDRIDLVPAAYEELVRLDFTLAIPITSAEKLIAIYFIGSKKSKDLFTYQDLQLLDHLTSEVGVLINNARLYEDLKKLDEAKSNFISVVSHQLRTPLSAMRWTTELLLDGAVDKKSEREFLKDTYKNSIFMIYHLDDMLTALDVEDKEIELKKEACVLQQFIDEVLKENEVMIKSKKLDIKIAIAKEAGTIICDSKKIKKVFEVLLANAFQYSPDVGGKIEIAARKKVDGDRAFLEISVADNGMGISPEEQRYIFEKFFRGEEAKKISPNGFGLGLFIVRAFARAHGGGSHFESAGRNKGAKFYFTFAPHNEK